MIRALTLLLALFGLLGCGEDDGASNGEPAAAEEITPEDAQAELDALEAEIEEGLAED